MSDCYREDSGCRYHSWTYLEWGDVVNDVFDLLGVTFLDIDGRPGHLPA